MYERVISLFSLFLFWGSLATAASPAKGVKSFDALAPDTVEQGVPFVVTYRLTSTSWKADGKPLAGNGFNLRRVDYRYVNGRPFSQMMAATTYITSRTGSQELPGMTVTVGTQKIKSAKKTVYVKPNQKYGEEMTYAYEWLVKQGKSVDSIALAVTMADTDFMVLEDQRNECFCMIARKSVWPIVGEPVLAYSTDNAMYLKEGKGNQQELLSVYKQQISALKRQGKLKPRMMSYKPKHHAVAPLLDKMEWGQHEPYNYFSPTVDGKKTLLGCVPLAVSMVANYYQWPSQGMSHTYYQDLAGKVYKLDFTNSKPLWNLYRPHYERNDTSESVKQLSKYLTFMGLALEADFGEKGTSAYMGNIKHVMCNNMRYSGKMAFYRKDMLNDDLTESLLYREMDHHRPCIVSNEGHAFVCDGYKDGFLHFNLGWYGAFNGYYRLKLGDYEQEEGKESLLLVKYLICGIEPKREELTREVVLNKAGTLGQMLTQQEMENLTSLTVSGPLNSLDIAILRKMAGAVNYSSLEEWRGSLTVLNLEKATIKSDDSAYLTEKAHGWYSRTTTVGIRVTSVKYDFGHMTEKDWKGFKRDIGTKQNGVYYTRTDDNRYWQHYTCNSKTIGKSMFRDCSSLRKITLPENTYRIDDYAFAGCASLQRIKLPAAVKETGKKPFTHCTALEVIMAPKGMSKDGILAEECSPQLRQITYY